MHGHPSNSIALSIILFQKQRLYSAVYIPYNRDVATRYIDTGMWDCLSWV